MRPFRSLPMVLSVLMVVLLAGVSAAQDVARVAGSVYKCTFENERARVCEVRFKPGESVAVHSHPDHIVYVITGSKLRLTPAQGAPSEIDFKAGQVMWVPAQTHSAMNIGSTELRGVLIELKEVVSDPTTQALMQMERDWSQALVAADSAALDRIMASDWVMTDPSGRRTTRAESMADLRSGAMKFESMTPLDLEVRVFGDSAVVTGRSRDKGTFKGQDVSGEYRFTDVFVKRDGRWQAVSTHVTKVMP